MESEATKKMTLVLVSLMAVCKLRMSYGYVQLAKCDIILAT